MMAKKIVTIVSTVLFVFGMGLSIYWFGWKMFVVLMLWFWANNIAERYRQ